MIVVVAGRRIDPPQAAAVRFPLSMRRAVAERIRATLSDLRATTVVASAACGADLLALDTARSLRVRRHIILPYREDWFREDSVTDRPGVWRPLYQRLITIARASGDLVILQQPRGTDDAFRAVNDALLDEAQRLAREERPSDPTRALAGLIVWEGAPRGPDDVTEHMRQRLVDAGATIATVLTAR